jgi:hypothetical protein
MLETDEDGGVARHLGLGSDGHVEYRCGPDQFGVWNDEIYAWDKSVPPPDQRTVLLREFDGELVDASAFEDKWSAGTSAPGAWPNEAPLADRARRWLRGRLPDA